MASRFALTARSWATVLLLVFGLPRLGVSQAVACTYDQCAIRTESRFFSTRLVAGREGKSLAQLGMFPPRVQVLELASDSARRYYTAFRSARQSGAWLSLGSLALLTGAVIFAADRPRHDGASVGFLVGGFALSFGAGISFRRSSNHLERAIWWYNRDLPGRL